MSTTLEQLQYGFDRNSRRTWQRRSLTDTQDQHYGYDSLGQVSTAARGSLNLNATAISGRPASSQSWDYDPTGNWRGYHSAANGTPTLDQHRVHDRGNRLTQIEDNPNNMILDRVGRMRQMSPDAGGDWDGKLEITWDAWSRITSVKNNGEVVGNYAYDGSHRRSTREVDGETLHSYYNDVWRPVEERKDSATTASISYLWGSRHRDDLVRRDRAVGGSTLNEKRYVLMDYFNPVAITDDIGELKERYSFSAFGVRTILNPDFTVRSSSECDLEFAFQGQFLDMESGLMNYGYRYYSPQLGRWTCKDPAQELDYDEFYSGAKEGDYLYSASEGEGGIYNIFGEVKQLSQSDSNIYQFCLNSPTTFTDFLGLNPALRPLIGPAARTLGRWIARRLAARAAARKLAQRIAECVAIHAGYKAAELLCRGCNGATPAAEAAKNCACWSAILAGRLLYLSKKCDYVLPGSIARGSKIAEAGHKKEYATKAVAQITCCACAVAGGK